MNVKSESITKSVDIELGMRPSDTGLNGLYRPAQRGSVRRHKRRVDQCWMRSSGEQKAVCGAPYVLDRVRDAPGASTSREVLKTMHQLAGAWL